MVGEVRAIGLIGAIELVRDKGTKQSFDPKLAVAASLVKRAQEHGVILRVVPDGIAFCPPLVANDEEIAEMFRRFGKALDETHAWLKKEGLASAA